MDIIGLILLTLGLITADSDVITIPCIMVIAGLLMIWRGSNAR